MRATGPRTSDKRWRFGFLAKRSTENAEIKSIFAEGLHYVGDWHTHPERQPSPSTTDIRSMTDIAIHTAHELPGLLMIIVGQSEGAEGLWISLHAKDGAVINGAISTQ